MKRKDHIRLNAFDRSMTWHGGSAAAKLDIVLEDAKMIEEYLLGVPPMRVLDRESVDIDPHFLIKPESLIHSPQPKSPQKYTAHVAGQDGFTPGE